uniref:Solute carrier organic anion transporter family member 3A1 n=1 Tax=Knipowitschia caucasica TaxID=637954 RepID=A0AAV2KT82_KNICA
MRRSYKEVYLGLERDLFLMRGVSWRLEDAECALMLAQGTVGAYLVSVLTTLERRFSLQSADVGVIASSFEIGNLALILFVSYFGARAHRPRLIGCGGIVMALGALLSALPEFLTSQYQVGKTWRSDAGREVCSNSSRGALEEDSACDGKANTNMMYLLLIGAQVLLGVGATPVQPLGVAYIDDHVRKKDSSLYIEPSQKTIVRRRGREKRRGEEGRRGLGEEERRGEEEERGGEEWRREEEEGGGGEDEGIGTEKRTGRE